jgi:hypothetical protein
MIIVPTTGEFPDKVFCTKCTEEDFVIGQMFRCSGEDLLYLCFSNPLYFPSVISSGPVRLEFWGGKKISENRDKTLFGAGRGRG